MTKRIISGFVGVVLLFIVVVTGGNVLNIAVCLVTLIAVHEFDSAIRKGDYKTVVILNYILTLVFFTMVTFYKSLHIDVVLTIYAIVLISLMVFRKNIQPTDIGMTIFSGIYIPFFIFHLPLLSNNILIWLIFITAFGTDTFAYFVGNIFKGKKIGTYKLCSDLSPNKTIIGAVGGIIGSLVLTLVFVYTFKTGNIFQIGVLSVIASIMAQIGDLAASRIKRTVNIKDYGKVMPGHGGILDRFDSILFTTPIVYYYITYLI